MTAPLNNAPGMTPEDFKQRRQRLGLSQAGLANELGLKGKNAGRTVRRWELGEVEIPGPIRLALLALEAGLS